MPPWLRLALFALGGLIGLFVLAWLLQRRLQYFPSSEAVDIPPGERWRDVEAVSLEAADGMSLEAWFWPGTKDATVLLLHGNAGHRGHRLEWMEGLHRRGWSVFLLDYRGYGGSAGHPSEEGFAKDADAAVAWLAARGRKNVTYLGESIGCGVAVGLAGRRPPTGLILMSGAVSLVPVAQHAYPFLPAKLFLRDRFDVRSVAAGITCPALCIHGDLDEIIPVSAGRALFEALGGEKTWWEVEGATHNGVVTVAGARWYERVHAFLEALDG